MELDTLWTKALAAANASYSPYSRFRVGAALLLADGSVVTGTNVENRSYGLTICAERSAVVAAVSKGQRQFAAIAIATPDADYPVGPCGACRQVLGEFLAADAPVVFGSRAGALVRSTMGELLPLDSLHELAARSGD